MSDHVAYAKDMKRMTRRRIGLVVSAIAAVCVLLLTNIPTDQATIVPDSVKANGPAVDALEILPVKGRAPKTGYSRSAFGDGWKVINGCDTRQIILNRDMRDVVLSEDCKVQSGTLSDPYTGGIIAFSRSQSDKVQIDHVVALSDAWQKGAQQLSRSQREQLANDPLELLAVDGPANQEKSDGDAATWLPSNQAFRCEYVSRQIAVKKKYSLWVTDAEKTTMRDVLARCSDFPLVQ
jgi:hypothetical protein